MNKNRLFQKFLATFLSLVLLPFMVIFTVLLVRANDLQLENDIAHNENLADQTLTAIRQQAELAENMCKAVVQNQNLTNFLDKEYESTSDLMYYQTTIRDFVKVTNGISDIKLRIYLENESIPLGFGIFYPMRYIDRTGTFRDFYASDEEAIWLDGCFDQELPLDQRLGEDNTYHYLMKIQVGTRRIGIIEAKVPQSVFSVKASSSETVLEPLELASCHLYNYAGQALTEEQIAQFFVEAGMGHNRKFVYSYVSMPKGPFDIVVVSGRSATAGLTLILGLLLPILFTIMMAGFFQYNHRIIKDIHSCLDGMELEIASNFELEDGKRPKQIQEAVKRKDEIATMAQRIDYLLSQIRTLLVQKVRQQTIAKETELLALQHQINPHFLYNTMEVFSARMELAGLYEESSAISSFCRMLRYCMNTKDLMTTLADEIQQVRYYLAIQKIRNIPFIFTVDIPEELQMERSIRFLLEPFVENCFKYRGTADPLKITILAREQAQGIEITIENNGEPLSPEQVNELNQRFQSASASMKTTGSHIGLNNINSRLKLFYGEQCFIQVESRNGITSFRFLIERKPL